MKQAHIIPKSIKATDEQVEDYGAVLDAIRHMQTSRSKRPPVTHYSLDTNGVAWFYGKKGARQGICPESQAKEWGLEWDGKVIASPYEDG